MKGPKILNWIKEKLDEGKTIYVQTMTRTTAISPKTAKNWERKGLELFKIVNGDLFMASGKNFVKLTSGNINLVQIGAK